MPEYKKKGIKAMKFIHLSDLHIGKKVNEFSMIEDQKYILSQILDIIDDEKVDAVVIAGDVYDKSIAPTEAIDLFDEFVTKLYKRGLAVFIIAGNHDSAERVSCYSALVADKKIYISREYNGKIEPIILQDNKCDVNVYMLPFIKPSNVKRFYPDVEINSYTDAMQVVVKNMNVDTSKRNILITHQFVTGADRTESEDISVGGTDNVDVTVFDVFDYVALGHIHRAQKCSREEVRYCGTPLKYSFSESKDQKSVTVVEMHDKGNIKIETVNLKPIRDMHEIKGKYDELMSKAYYEKTTYENDYMHITLTDEEDIPNAIGKLRTVYKNLMKLDYDNTRTKTNSKLEIETDVERKSPLELFSEFYELQNNKEMSQEQKEYINDLIEKVWGEQ